MNFKKIGVIAITDILILAELAVAINIAGRQPETLALTFFQVFLPIAGLTILVCRYILRKYFSDPPVEVVPLADQSEC